MFIFDDLTKIVFKVDGLTGVIFFYQILSNSLNECKHPMVYSHFQNLYMTKACKPIRGKGVKSYESY